MPRYKQATASPITSPPPAIEPEEYTDQLILMAYERAKQQLMDGTISAAALTHFLKLGSEREKNNYELQKLKAENELLKAKTEAIRDAQRLDQMYANAIAAMGSYAYDRGQLPDEEEEEDV